jgi:hypothetical protein
MKDEMKNLKNLLINIVALIIKISNVLLITFFALSIILLIVVFIVDKRISDGYFLNWIINLMLTSSDEVFQFFYLFSENNFIKFNKEIGLIILLIIGIIILNIIVKKIAKSKKIGKIIIACINITANCFLMVHVTIIVLYLFILNYFIGISSEISLKGSLNNSIEVIDTLRDFLSNNHDIATIALKKIEYDIKNKIIDIDKLNDKEYISLALNICELFEKKGNVISMEEHYLRNYFSRGPDTLDEMIETIKTNNIVFGWMLMKPEDTLLHMFGNDGEYNIKFISADGHFEVIYNKNRKKLTIENSPINMGTLNYADPLSNPERHFTLDVLPCFIWGNTPYDDYDIDKGGDANPRDYYENEDAIKHYNEIQKKIIKR